MDSRDAHLSRSATRRRRLQPRREPSQARARARVEAILAATIDLLAARDVDDITTAAIARRAKIPIGSVYHYFPSKEGILAELVARTTSRVDAAFVANLARDLGRVPWQRAVERALEGSVLAYRSDAAFIAVWRATRGTQAFRDAASTSDERFAESLAELPLLRGRIRLHAMRAAIRIANAFLDWVLESPDLRERARIVRELKRAVIAYLMPEFERAGWTRDPIHRRTRAARSRS